MRSSPARALALATLLLALPVSAASLLQAAFDPSVGVYVFGYDSIPEIPAVGAPKDTDWSRTAMLHDGLAYRLYAFRSGSDEVLYQFSYDQARGAYVYGHASIRELRIVGAPRDADTSSFAMLHDGEVYRLYLQRRGDPSTLYQFAFDPTTQEYRFGHRSQQVIQVTGMPADTDWSRWAMVHDGSDYRFYALRRGGASLYQAAWDVRAASYRYGFNSIAEIPIRGGPRDLTDFAMLHDGISFRLYAIAVRR